MEYIKTDLKSIIEVSKLVTVYYFNCREPYEPDGGEKHDFYELVYIDKGPITMNLDGKPYLLNEGDILLYMPNVFHEGIPENAGKTMGIISFVSESPQLKRLEGVIKHLTADERKLFFDVLREGMPLFDVVKEGLKLKEGVSDFQLQILKNKLELLLLSILNSEANGEKSQIATQSNSTLPLAEKIYAFLQNNISAQLNLNILSQTFAVSITNLKTSFRERYNCGIIDKFIDLKISRAKGLLKDGEFSVAEISELLGFSTPHYFAKQFKKRAGLTPTEYKRKIEL